MQVSAAFPVEKLSSSLPTTIRIRRIKRDETKPECKRCMISGWKCQRYNILDPQVQQFWRSQCTSSQSSSKTEVKFLSQIQSHSPIFKASESENGNELRSFKYFQSYRGILRIRLREAPGARSESYGTCGATRSFSFKLGL